MGPGEHAVQVHSPEIPGDLGFGGRVCRQPSPIDKLAAQCWGQSRTLTYQDTEPASAAPWQIGSSLVERREGLEEQREVF